MNMKTEIIVANFSHYNMTDNKGLAVQIFGGAVDTNNERGLSITRSEVSNYDELEYLKTFPKEFFPAKFSANMEFGKKKDKNGKEVTTAIFSSLNYISSLELVEKKKEKVTS
jgi:hypothetical protein